MPSELEPQSSQPFQSGNVVRQWTLDRYSDKTIFFWKEDEAYGYFCQWYMCEMTDEFGQKFNCCEQYMMYHKAKTFNDTSKMAQVLREKSPRMQKALGRQVKGFSADEWEKVRVDVVVRGNRLKFTQCNARPFDKFVYPPDGINDGDGVVSLKELLLATGDCELAEASKFDSVWGIGMSEEAARNTPRKKWGENLLGKALMRVRAELREEPGGEEAVEEQ